MSGTPAGALVKDVVTATTSIAAAAISHVGWWLEWQTRTRAGDGCRPLGDSDLA
jgi:hypothetical protein